MTVNTESKPHSRSKYPASILEHFDALPDPRREHGKIHLLDEIVFMSICAVLCGADNWKDIALYSHSKADWLKTFLSCRGESPRMIRSAESSACSTRWPSRRVSPTGSPR